MFDNENQLLIFIFFKCWSNDWFLLSHYQVVWQSYNSLLNSNIHVWLIRIACYYEHSCYIRNGLSVAFANWFWLFLEEFGWPQDHILFLEEFADWFWLVKWGCFSFFGGVWMASRPNNTLLIKLDMNGLKATFQ
jgi:hypothetical protein